MNPSLVLEAGRPYEAAALLLANDIASLSKEEFVAKIILIRNSSYEKLMDAFEAFEQPQAIGVTTCLMTRFAAEPGMSEISDVVLMGALYMDKNTPMAPEAARYESGWIEKHLPSVANFADSVADLALSIIITKSPEIDSASPPSIVAEGRQNPGYSKGLFVALSTNFTITEDYDVTDVTAGSTSKNQTAPPKSLIEKGLDWFKMGDPDQIPVNE